MNLNLFLRLLITFMVIIGGVIVFIFGRPVLPEPQRIVCGVNFINLGGIAEMIVGVAVLVVQNTISNSIRGQSR